MKLSVIFKNPKSDETIIPVHWFNEGPKLVICLSFCSTNEVESLGIVVSDFV